jgi:transposase InsO family protein
LAATWGSQYTSEQFQHLLVDNGVICSMSRSGNVWDNAKVESFLSLKIERAARKTYRTHDEAKADVFDYIERFYNPKRRADPGALGSRYVATGLSIPTRQQHRCRSPS